MLSLLRPANLIGQFAGFCTRFCTATSAATVGFSCRILLDQNVDHISFRPELLRPSHEEFAVICCAVERSVHQFRHTVLYPQSLVRCDFDEAL